MRGTESGGSRSAWMALQIALFLLVTACGGSTPAPDPWQPSQRQHRDYFANHWWWHPVEQPCDDNDDCRPGEQCRNMRLGTCAGCPRGQTERMCVGPQEDPRQPLQQQVQAGHRGPEEDEDLPRERP